VIDLSGMTILLTGGTGSFGQAFLRRVTTNRALYGDPAWHRERLWRLATSSAAVPA